MRCASSRAIAGLALAVVVFAALGPPEARAGEDYVLALTWHPGFCAVRRDWAECRTAAPEHHLVLHGLWPPRGAAYCGVAPGIEVLDRRIEDERRGRWEDLPALDITPAMRDRLLHRMPGARSGLDRHEWYKHGSCVLPTPEVYYETALRLAAEIGATRFARFLSESSGQTIKRSALLGAFETEFGAGSGRALSLQCRDGRLEEIRLFLDRARIAEPFSAKSLAPQPEVPRGNCRPRVEIAGPAAD